MRDVGESERLGGSVRDQRIRVRRRCRGGERLVSRSGMGRRRGGGENVGAAARG